MSGMQSALWQMTRCREVIVNSRIGIALLAISTMPAAHSQSLTTTVTLKDDCIAAEQLIATISTQPVPNQVAAKGIRCLGYLRGHVEATIQAQAARTAKPTYCPENASALQVTDFRQWASAFVKYADAHPERSTSPAADTLAVLMAEAAPCKP